MVTSQYRGYTVQTNGGQYSYRAQTWDMWSAPMSLAECLAEIDAELASQSTSPRHEDTCGCCRCAESRGER